MDPLPTRLHLAEIIYFAYNTQLPKVGWDARAALAPANDFPPSAFLDLLFLDLPPLGEDHSLPVD